VFLLATQMDEYEQLALEGVLSSVDKQWTADDASAFMLISAVDRQEIDVRFAQMGPVHCIHVWCESHTPLEQITEELHVIYSVSSLVVYMLVEEPNTVCDCMSDVVAHVEHLIRYVLTSQRERGAVGSGNSRWQQRRATLQFGHDHIVLIELRMRR
jgi:hypothetical protein